MKKRLERAKIELSGAAAPRWWLDDAAVKGALAGDAGAPSRLFTM